jgi:hypothetical protein
LYSDNFEDPDSEGKRDSALPWTGSSPRDDEESSLDMDRFLTSPTRAAPGEGLAAAASIVPAVIEIDEESSNNNSGNLDDDDNCDVYDADDFEDKIPLQAPSTSRNTSLSSTADLVSAATSPLPPSCIQRALPPPTRAGGTAEEGSVVGGKVEEVESEGEGEVEVEVEVEGEGDYDAPDTPAAAIERGTSPWPFPRISPHDYSDSTSFDTEAAAAHIPAPSPAPSVAFVGRNTTSRGVGASPSVGTSIAGSLLNETSTSEDHVIAASAVDVTSATDLSAIRDSKEDSPDTSKIKSIVDQEISRIFGVSPGRLQQQHQHQPHLAQHQQDGALGEQQNNSKILKSSALWWQTLEANSSPPRATTATPTDSDGARDGAIGASSSFHNRLKHVQGLLPPAVQHALSVNSTHPGQQRRFIDEETSRVSNIMMGVFRKGASTTTS